jgi:hypothetical protein
MSEDVAEESLDGLEVLLLLGLVGLRVLGEDHALGTRRRAGSCLGGLRADAGYVALESVQVAVDLKRGVWQFGPDSILDELLDRRAQSVPDGIDAGKVRLRHALEGASKGRWRGRDDPL